MAAEIAYQNRDILLKILSENYKNKTFSAYGLNLPPIKEVLPTNLPALQVNEKRADNIFLLADESILILEYESKADSQTALKYGHYAFRVAETYCKEKVPKIIIAVIYTADITKAPGSLDLGSVKLSWEQVFLAKLDGEAIFDDLKTKVESKKPLTETDIMNFVILPLTQKKNKQKFVEKTVTLAQEIADEDIQSFIVAGILTAADKFIDKLYSKKMRRWLTMTKVGRLFEEEKLEYAQKYGQNERKQEKLEIARKMLVESIDILTIMKVTMLSKSEILALQNEPVNT
ncbi:MAG: hypothetical protein LBR56_00125 [Sporomusaceae bacterium]|nr:hypothetical protein [Sporomusaceae bacterium]